MPLKMSLLIQLNTVPTDLAEASAHIGGWSETIWDTSPSVPVISLNRLANKRAILLPESAKIVGYRAQVYTIVGNQLVPGGSATGAFNYPGSPSRTCDLPQVALLLKAGSETTSNTRKFTLRGIPDGQMSGGEFQPTAAFKAALTIYRNELIDGHWYFPARDLTQASVRILSIVNRVVRTADPIAGAAVDGFVRLLNVRDEDGNGVSGTYAIEIAAANAYTLRNFDPAIVAGASGRIRRDLIAMYNIGTCEVSRAVVKKIGRPFEQYRGRRSSRA